MDADWDDLKLFLIVAERGGLAGASTLTGISAPTIGRRMLVLERRLGRSLFVRSQQGYRLAHDGHVLMEHARAMQAVAEGIADWHKGAFAWPIVSIAGDAWMAGFVADHAADLRTSEDTFRYCCRALDVGSEMTFRGVDVALLAERPTGGNLATRRSIAVRYCAYRAADIEPAAMERWISLGTEHSRTPADRWVFENRESKIFTWTGSSELLLRLVRQGVGIGVLPVFRGDAEPGLVREGSIIEALTHPVHVTVNDDDRKRPEVRLVIDRLTALLKREEARFAG